MRLVHSPTERASSLCAVLTKPADMPEGRRGHSSDVLCVSSVGSTSLSRYRLLPWAQVVQVCAEHKKLGKLLKHLEAVGAASPSARSPPRMLIFCNKIKACHIMPLSAALSMLAVVVHVQIAAYLIAAYGCPSLIVPLIRHSARCRIGTTSLHVADSVPGPCLRQ